MTHPQRCPTHSRHSDNPLNAWACPDECPHFEAELVRRIDDVKVHGNFTRMWRTKDGEMVKQRFENHQPVAEPEPVTWMKKKQEEH